MTHRSMSTLVQLFTALPLLFGSLATLAQEEEMTFSPMAEATIYEERADENGGGFDEFCVGNLANPGMTRRALLQFDLSGLPDGATVTAVTLTMRQIQVRDRGIGAPKEATLELRRLNAAWMEGSGGSPDPGLGQKACGGGANMVGVDWNAQPASQAGASGSAALNSLNGMLVTVDSQASAANQPLVTDVQAWHDDASSNAGWLLQLQEEGSADNARLMGNVELTVTYSTDSEPTLEINAGMNDAWLNFDTVGQGFFVTVFPDTGLIFVAWFTFDTALPAEDSANLGYIGHRWLTAIGTWDGNKASLDFELTRDGLFDDARDVDQTQGYGTLMLEFHDCNNATATYDIPAAGVMGSISLTRAVSDNVAMCEALGTPQ